MIQTPLLALAATGLACLWLVSSSVAQPLWVSGTGSITHAQRADGTGALRVPVVPNVNAFALPVFSASTYQYSSSTHPQGNIVFGTATSTARAGLGRITQPSYFGIGIASGTAITQRGNTNTSPDAASAMTISFSGQWTIGPAGVSGLRAGASMGIVGNVPSPSLPAFTQINLTANFRYRTPGNEVFLDMRPPINAASRPGESRTPFFFRGVSGAFTASPSDIVAANPSGLPPGTVVIINGTMTLMVHNDDIEALMKLDLDASTLLPSFGVDYVPGPLPEPPPEAVFLGEPNCFGFEPRVANIPEDGVSWFSFDLPSRARFGSSRYLDVALDINGNTTRPVAVGLYRADGSLVAADQFSGFERVVGQLSFGGSRRGPRTLGAADFDGRSGNLEMAGRYYLAFGTEGAEFGAENFGVIPSAFNDPNSVSFRVSTNTVRGCTNLPAATPPTDRERVGTLVDDTASSINLPLDPTGVTWLTFQLASPIDPSRPTRFLTIDTRGTDGIDTMLAVFDAVGNPVSATFFDDDSYGDGLSQLDFRQAAATRPSTGPAQVPLDGRNGMVLREGLYYVAVSPFRATYAGRDWGARTNGPTAGTVRVNLRTGALCPADFDGDSQLTPDDLADYIACFFSIPPCSQADFSGDGGVDPDDLADFITAFFGGC